MFVFCQIIVIFLVTIYFRKKNSFFWVQCQLLEMLEHGGLTNHRSLLRVPKTEDWVIIFKVKWKGVATLQGSLSARRWSWQQPLDSDFVPGRRLGQHGGIFIDRASLCAVRWPPVSLSMGHSTEYFSHNMCKLPEPNASFFLSHRHPSWDWQPPDRYLGEPGVNSSLIKWNTSSRDLFQVYQSVVELMHGQLSFLCFLSNLRVWFS